MTGKINSRESYLSIVDNEDMDNEDMDNEDMDNEDMDNEETNERTDTSFPYSEI